MLCAWVSFLGSHFIRMEWDCEISASLSSKSFFCCLLFVMGQGLNGGLCTYKAGAHKAGTLPFEPHLQSSSRFLFIHERPLD
jgi:hypothetical protein